LKVFQSFSLFSSKVKFMATGVTAREHVSGERSIDYPAGSGVPDALTVPSVGERCFDRRDASLANL